MNYTHQLCCGSFSLLFRRKLLKTLSNKHVAKASRLRCCLLIIGLFMVMLSTILIFLEAEPPYNRYCSSGGMYGCLLFQTKLLCISDNFWMRSISISHPLPSLTDSLKIPSGYRVSGSLQFAMHLQDCRTPEHFFSNTKSTRVSLLSLLLLLLLCCYIRLDSL